MEYAQLVIQNVLGGIVLSLGIIGNIIVIIFFGFYRKQNSSYKLFIALLGVSDLICSLCGLFCQCLPSILNNDMYYGTFIQRYIKPLSYVSACASAWILLGMAFERYRGIVYPFRKNLMRRHVSLYCVVAFIVYLLLHIPVMRPAEESNDECFAPYITILIMAKLIIPSIFMCYLYILIKRSLALALGQLSGCCVVSIRKRNRSALRTLKLVIIVFIVCVTPFECLLMFSSIISCYYTSVYKSIYMNKEYQIVQYTLEVSFYFNSTVNCFIYAAYIPEFQRFLKSLFSCCFLRRIRQLTATNHGNFNKETQL